ncbi:MAG: DUF1552 domain-containing protein [Myxococcota bacterium]
MDRRMFLRSTGATLWLPFLASALPRGARAAVPTPRRALWWFVPNGLVSDYVRPTQLGAGYDLPLALQGIAPLQSRISVISGLKNRAAIGYDAHEEAMPTLLGDDHVDNTFNGPLDAAMTVDQFAAQQIGSETPFGSLQLGTDEPYISGGGNVDVLYRTLSWAGPSTPISPLTDPKTVFQRMFGGTSSDLTAQEIEIRATLRKSLLDSVLDRTKALDARLNPADKAKLDQYTTGVRELELRLDQLEGLSCPEPGEPDASPGYQQKIALMTDLMVVALQCDFTRLVTFLTGASTALTTYNWLGHSNDHHTLSHNWSFSNTAARDLQQVYDWQVQRYVELCTKLADIPTEDGDLLSSTQVILLSEFGESNLHQAEPLTFLLAGGEAGDIVQGQHRAFPNQPHSNLWLSVLEHLQCDPQGYGTTTTGPLDLRST